MERGAFKWIMFAPKSLHCAWHAVKTVGRDCKIFLGKGFLSNLMASERCFFALNGSFPAHLNCCRTYPDRICRKWRACRCNCATDKNCCCRSGICHIQIFVGAAFRKWSKELFRKWRCGIRTILRNPSISYEICIHHMN